MQENNQVNPYDEIVDQFSLDKEKKLRASMLQAVTKKPDAQAQIVDLSKRANLPVPLVERNTEAVRNRVDFQKNPYDDILKNYKSVAEFLSDPVKASLAHDDIDAITKVADLTRSFGAGGTGMFGSGLSGVVDIYEAIQNKIPDLLPDDAARAYRERQAKKQIERDKEHPLIKMFYPENQLKYAGSQLKDLAENMRPPEERRGFDTDVSEGLGQLGAQILMTVVTGGAGSGTLFAGMGADEMAERADVGGATQEQKDNAVLMGSLVTAASEKIGIDLLLNKLPPMVKNRVVNKLAELAIGGGIEFTQEGVEGFLQNVVESITFNPDKELTEGVLPQAEVGGAVGLIAKGVLMATGARTRNANKDNISAYNAQRHTDEINQLLDRVSEMKLNERSPEEAATLFQSFMEEQGVEEFTIDVDTFIEQVESAGGDATEIATRLGIDQQFEDAILYHGSLKVPAGKFLSEFADSEFREAAVNSFRPNPNSMTAKEADDYISNIERETQATIEAAGFEADEILVMENKADQVYDAVVSAIEQGGVELRTGQRRPIAELFRAQAMRQMADWQAEGKEFDPKAFLDSFGLSFTNEADGKKDTAKSLRNVKDLNLSGMLNELRGRKERGNELSPLFEYIKKSGKIKTGSQLAKELASMGINPKTNVGLFSKDGTFGDADNLVASEFQDMFGVAPQVDDNGYVDRNWLLEKIGDGSLGNTQVDEIDNLSEIINRMGLDINEDNDALIEKLLGDQELNQAVDVQSEAFKNWFGDSKVVDENGDPLVVYHGGSFDETLDDSFFVENINWFSEEKQKADNYAGNLEVTAVYLSIKNPVRFNTKDIAEVKVGDFIGDLSIAIEELNLDDDVLGDLSVLFDGLREYHVDKGDYQKYFYEYWKGESGEIVREILEYAGYDGIANNEGGVETWGAFSPEQIKSIHNRGTFDPNDARILYQGNTDQTKTDEFKNWAGTDNEVIEADEINDTDFTGEGPYILKAFHGTTHLFEEFDATRGSKEGHFGAINYFTSSQYDADDNYAGEGPDLTQKIDTRAEQLADEIQDYYEEFATDEEGITAIKERYGEEFYSEDTKKFAYNIARSELSGGNNQTLELYIKTKKPFVVGEDGQWLNLFDTDGIYEQAVQEIADENDVSVDEARDEFEDDIYDRISELESESESPLINAIELVADRFDEVNAGEVISSIYDLGGEFTSSQLEEILRTSEGSMYATDPETGAFSLGEFIADVIQEMGYDSIILKNADKQFSNMNIEYGTAHIHVFDANKTNIKSATDNSGKFDPNNPSILHQNKEVNRGGIRGDFGNLESKFQIFTTKDADMSTLLHETGHLFLEMMYREASMEDAPQRVKNNLKDTLDYLGVESYDQIGTNEHELFARSFEVYLREGKAPNFRLRRVFEKFKAWLVEVYQRLTGKYNIEVTPEVKKIFDTILATEEEIIVAEQDSDIKISPAIAELMGGDARTSYLEAAEDAHAEAYNQALVSKIRAEKRRLTKQWNEDKKRVEKNITDQVWSEDVYQVWHLITKGEFFNQETPDAFKGKRLDKASLVDIAGSTGVLKDLPKTVPPMHQVGGIDVEILAMEMGFTSGDHLIKELINAERPLDKIKRVTDETMEAEYPMPDPAEEAMKAVHNERQAIFLDTELKAITKRVKGGDPKSTLQIVREEVDRLIAKMPMKDVMKPLQYLANSRRAGKAAEKALIAEDYETAMHEKRKQLFNHEMFRKTLDAKTQADKIQKRLGKLANKKIDPKRIAPEYIKSIKELLGAYSFGVVNIPRKASDVINQLLVEADKINKTADQDGMPNVVIPEKLIEASNLTHWRDLTFDQLSALNDTVKSLEKLGRQETQAEKEDRLKIINEMAVSIEDNVKTRKDAGTIKDQSNFDASKAKFKHLVSGSFLRRLPSLLNEFDGGKFNGLMSKHILTPLEDAAAKYEELISPIRENMEALQKKNYSILELKRMGKRNLYVKQINETLTKEEILSLALNWGNIGNREAVLNGVPFKGLTEVDVMNILNEHMEQKDWNFVQGSLDIVNSLWPEIAALEERQSGVIPAKIEASPIETKFGTYAGGYYPLSYSAVSSTVANQKAHEAQTDKPVLGSARASTKHGHTIERTSGHGLPVRLSLSTMYDHLGKVVHDLAYREAIQNANKYIRNPIIGDAIIKTKGLKAYENIQLILKAQATGDAGFMSGWDKAGRYLRLNFAVAVIGLNMRSILTQPTGLMQAFVSNKVGTKYMASSLMNFVKNGYHLNTMINDVQEKSPYMKQRAKVFRQELREQAHKVGTTGLKDKVVAASFYPMIKMDAMTATIVWLGAYQKGIDQGYNEADAIRYADRMVRDTQASGEQYQLSGLTNSGEIGKSLTIFGSYFSATYNLTVESFRQAQVEGDPKAWATFAMDMILLHGVQGMLAALMLEHWPDDDDDWFRWSLLALGSQVTGMIPVASSIYRSMVSGYDVSLLPAEAAVNTGIRTSSSIYSDLEKGKNPINEKNIKNLARTASYFMGIPAINGIIRGYEILDENPDASVTDVLLRPKEK